MTRDIRKRDRRANNRFSSNRRKVAVRSVGEELEAKLGFDLFNEGDKLLGWQKKVDDEMWFLVIFCVESSLQDQDSGRVYSCVDLYFVAQDGSSFKAKYKFRPYFYAATKDKMEIDVKAYLRRRYENDIIDIEIVDKEDLDLVADFGLAKFSLDTNTHVSTRVMGSFRYMAPEYASSGKLTDKSDVFSFGVMLLELITGCRPVDKAHPFADDSMVEWARPLLAQALESRSFDVLVDPRLHEYDSSEMATMIACAAACVRHSARLRPQMSK
ncbi:hypothetical protein Droror1_Dr00006389, partial [Drosera rotundifolia]